MKLKKLLITFIALMLFLFGLSMGYEDAVNEHDYYCQQVNDGTWPNYKEIDCEGE